MDGLDLVKDRRSLITRRSVDRKLEHLTIGEKVRDWRCSWKRAGQTVKYAIENMISKIWRLKGTPERLANNHQECRKDNHLSTESSLVKIPQSTLVVVWIETNSV